MSSACSPKKVYYQDSGYPIERNLKNLPLENYEVEKKIGILKLINHLHYKLKGTKQLLGNSHWELLKKSNAIWHFFNGISFGKTPWVTTFETKLPRWRTSSEWLLEKGMEAMASAKCRQLIALSECTREIQLQYMQVHFPSFAKAIAEKITVLHPSQQRIIESYSEKRLSENRISFSLVGADFFRKGGKEVLLVFDKLLKEGAPVELLIISRMDYGDYASRATKLDLDEALAIIDKYPDHISQYDHLPNQQVLELFKQSHVGLLPSYGETYGYAVLEAQACGCPVITTNIRAMPEINDDSCGWLISVPKDEWGNGILGTHDERSKFSNIITENLQSIIFDIISNPEQIEKKGRLSLKKISEDHNPEQAAHRLEGIYDEAFSLF